MRGLLLIQESTMQFPRLLSHLFHAAVAFALAGALLRAQQPLNHWRFETPGPLVLDSVGVDHGTPLGNPVYQADTASAAVRPVTGPSLQNQSSLGFSSSDVVSFGSTFPLHAPGDFTLEFWLKSPCTSHESVFWTRPDGQDTNRFNFYVNGNATFGFDYRDPAGTLVNLVGGAGSVPIPRNVWVHLTVTRAAGLYTLYVNGVASGGASASLLLPTAVGWSMSGRPGFPFIGQLDEVRISAGALRPTQLLTSLLDLGNGLAGTGNRTPGLGGIGTANGGTDLSLLMANAQPVSIMLLVVSPAAAYLPLLGGTLVPDPVASVSVFATTDSLGEWSLRLPVPSGLQSSQPFYFQAGILDAGAVRGVAMTNAVQIVTP
jgi:Concanavalin A-like lectin/glucanases superfamily